MLSLDDPATERPPPFFWTMAKIKIKEQKGTTAARSHISESLKSHIRRRACCAHLPNSLKNITPSPTSLATCKCLPCIRASGSWFASPITYRAVQTSESPQLPGFTPPPGMAIRWPAENAQTLAPSRTESHCAARRWRTAVRASSN
eukprot:scaffold1723_cov104-Isochrysis_galbana.AAC.5